MSQSEPENQARKKSFHLIDPQLRSGIVDAPPLHLSDEALPAIREAWDALIAPPLPPPAATVTERVIQGPPDNPNLRVFIIDPSPGGARRPALLHIHGGGYVITQAVAYLPLLQTYAAAANCVIVSVDYRLAPETPFPGALNDNYAALSWLHHNAEMLGVDPDRVAIGGESAGGGHAAMLTLAARDRGEIPIAFQFLVYPMLDDRTGTSRAVSPYIGEFTWTAACQAYGWSALLGVPAGSDQVPAGAVPARVEDLSHLPRTYIAISALDIFVEESLAYASRLIAAGVPVDLDLVAGGYHGFNMMAPDADVSKRFDTRVREALLRGLSAQIS